MFEITGVSLLKLITTLGWNGSITVFYIAYSVALQFLSTLLNNGTIHNDSFKMFADDTTVVVLITKADKSAEMIEVSHFMS